MSRPVPDEPVSSRGPVGHPGSARHLTVLVVAFVVTVTGTRNFCSRSPATRGSAAPRTTSRTHSGAGRLPTPGPPSSRCCSGRTAALKLAGRAGRRRRRALHRRGRQVHHHLERLPLPAGRRRSSTSPWSALSLAWVAYRARRRHMLTDRERLYHVLDGLQDLADGRLDSRTARRRSSHHLGHLRDEWDRPELRDLSARLEEFLLSPSLPRCPPRPGPLERLHERLLRLEERLVPEPRFRRPGHPAHARPARRNFLGVAVVVAAVAVLEPGTGSPLDAGPARAELDPVDRRRRRGRPAGGDLRRVGALRGRDDRLVPGRPPARRPAGWSPPWLISLSPSTSLESVRRPVRGAAAVGVRAGPARAGAAVPHAKLPPRRTTASARPPRGGRLRPGHEDGRHQGHPYLKGACPAARRRDAPPPAVCGIETGRETGSGNGGACGGRRPRRPSPSSS